MAYFASFEARAAILSTAKAIAPSPVTLHAVPKLSIAMYSAIIKACSFSPNPKMLLNGANAAIIAPPGTPGAATMKMASTKIKCKNNGKSWGIPSKRAMVNAQAVIFIAEPDR